MDQLYSAHGIRFRYPNDWELSENQDDRDISISVNSPDTSFWTLTLLDGRPAPERVLQEVVETLRGEYAEMDEYSTKAVIHQTECQACDLQFMQYEIINTAYVRACPAGSRTALILYQGMDRELESTRPILEAITASLEWDESGPPVGYY